MTDRERRLKKRIQFVVASVMASFFALILCLGILVAVNGSMRIQANNLQTAHDNLTARIRLLEDEMKHYIDPELIRQFIEEYALRVLGFGRDGSMIYIK